MLDASDSNTANKKLAEAKAKMDQEQAKVEDEMAKADQNVEKVKELTSSINAAEITAKNDS